MGIPRNLSNLAPGASSTGVLDVTKGGTGLATVGTNGQVLQSNGTALVFATPATTSPAGSTGQIQYNNAGAFGAVSDGTNGQVLTSAGAGSAPTWTNPSAGAMTFISTISPTSGIFQWTNLSGYNNYYLVINGIKYDAGMTEIRLQLGTGSGPTYITSEYSYIGWQTDTSGSSALRGSANQDGFRLFQTANGDTPRPTPLIGTVTLTNFLSTSTSDSRGIVYSTSAKVDSSSGRLITVQGAGLVGNISGAITAIRINSPVGTAFTGSVSLYGIST